MNFFRPEVLVLLRRWAEVIVAIAVLGLGLWIAARPGPVVQGFGYVLAAFAAIALIPAVRRARFTTDGDGPGIVQVIEGRILYMGPVDGGAISVAEMTSLSLRHDRGGQVAWVLVEPGHMLIIPVNAAGAEALFDAFTALPGLGAARILAARQSPHEGTRTLWRRADVPALTQ